MVLYFQEPQKLKDRWLGEWNAQNYGSACLQLDEFTNTPLENGSLQFQVHGDEDCLFVNIFTQEGGKKKLAIQP